MTAKKYELVKSESIVYNGKTLYRIRALRDFITVSGRTIKKGDLGGYVESEDNLSQEGNCWIFDNAKVYGNAKVFDDAIVNDSACIFDSAVVCGAAEIYNFAEISDNAIVCGGAMVSQRAIVFNEAKVFGNAWLYGTAKIGDKLSLNKGEYIFKSLDVEEIVNEIESVCKKIDFASKAMKSNFPVEKSYIENLISQFTEYSELADFLCGRTYLSPKEKEIYELLLQGKAFELLLQGEANVEILKK